MQKPAADLQGAVPARMPNTGMAPLASFPLEILAKQSYVSFESEPARGWLSRNATVPGHPGVLTLSQHHFMNNCYRFITCSVAACRPSALECLESHCTSCLVSNLSDQVAFAPPVPGKKLSIGDLNWSAEPQDAGGQHEPQLPSQHAGAATAFQGHGAFSHLSYPASGMPAADAMRVQSAISPHLQGAAGTHVHAYGAGASPATYQSHVQQHANLVRREMVARESELTHPGNQVAQASLTKFASSAAISAGRGISTNGAYTAARGDAETGHAPWIPPSISLESALSDRYILEHVPGHGGLKGAAQDAMRSAFEKQNKELMRLAASAERRATEMESSNAQLLREVANMKEGMHMTAMRANEEAMIRISQLQMQLAQSQSEAATSADINAEHMRAKMLLISETGNRK